MPLQKAKVEADEHSSSPIDPLGPPTLLPHESFTYPPLPNSKLVEDNLLAVPFTQWLGYKRYQTSMMIPLVDNSDMSMMIPFDVIYPLWVWHTEMERFQYVACISARALSAVYYRRGRLDAY